VIAGAALVVALAAAAPPAASPLPPEAVRLERALRGVASLKAEFVQIRDIALTGESVEARGTLAFRPPDRFRLAYVSPEKQELVVRGDSLWVIVPSENQAQRYPYRDDAPGSEVFLLFGGKGRSLSDAFTIVQEPWGTYSAALRLIPKAVEPGYPIEEIRLVVGKTGFPRRLFYRESTGDTVVFEFTEVDPNPPDIDALVALRIPKGMEVIEATPTRENEDLPIDRRQ
jgi:outer membrane lipoprotein-sorting protein